MDIEGRSNSVLREGSQDTKCGNISTRDLQSTLYATRAIAVSYSILFYFAVLLLSVLGVFFKACVRFSTGAKIIFFLIGALLVSLNVFINSSDFVLTLYHRIASGFSVGIVFVLFGASLFFSKPTALGNECTLGRQQPSMGLVVTVITFPLIVTEILLFLGAEVSKGDFTEYHRRLWVLILINGAVFLSQKLIQVAAYLCLRNKTTCAAHRENAEFYLKVLAFFNFIQWVDSQVNVETDIQMQRARQVYGAWFDVLETLYKALLIDYRLLCSFLFLEHSVEIQHEGNDAAGEMDNRNYRIMTSPDRQKRICGFVIGFSCLITPFLCAVFYIPKLHISPYIHASSTFINSTFIFVGGMLLLRANRLDFDERDKESKGVKMMICCLGAVGFACLMVKAGLAAFWASNGPHLELRPCSLCLGAAELAARGFTTIFLMVLFLKVNARALALGNPDVKINHVVVPVMMLGILADFIASLIDQYVGPIDKRLRCEIKDPTLKLLLEAGPPM